MSAWPLVWPWLLGLAVAGPGRLGSATGLARRLAAAWLLGCLGLGVLAQAALVGFGPTALTWYLPLWVAVVLWSPAGRWLRRNGQAGGAVVDTESAAWTERCWAGFLVVGSAVVLLFAAEALDRPCLEGDEGNIWALKAKSLLADWPDHFAAAQVYNLHPDYPQLNPLLQAWSYAVAGGVPGTLVANRWLIQGCALALWLALAGALRARLPAWAAAGLSLWLLGEPVFHELCRTAYADAMVALGLVVALDGWLTFRATGQRSSLRLAGCGLAFALWSKNEPLLYAGCFALAALLLRARPAAREPAPGTPVARPAWWWWWPALAVFACTTLWNRRFGLQSDLLGNNPTGKSMFRLLVEQGPERAPAMLREAWAAITSPQHGHLAFGLLPLVAAARGRAFRHSPLAMPTVAMLLAFVGLHVVYLGSFLPLRFHLDTSYLRVTFQLLPAALLLVGGWLAEVAGIARAGDTGRAS